MSRTYVETYQDACDLIQAWGIVPLGKGIPAHPSLSSCTRAESWHTDGDDDPWQWRVRLPVEGVAAYGRFLGSQTLFVDRALFSLLRASLRRISTLEEQAEEGHLSRYAIRLYELIADNPGLDVRLMRKLSGMDDKSLKKAFDRALVELQHSADIVISGVYDPRNAAQGAKNGWSSTCYMLAEEWMARHGIEPLNVEPDQAMDELVKRITGKWEPEAIQYLIRKWTNRRS